MRRHRRERLLRLSVLGDVVILLLVGTIGTVGLVHGRDHYFALIAIPIALIVIHVILRG
jgi:hypothetical protein